MVKLWGRASGVSPASGIPLLEQMLLGRSCMGRAATSGAKSSDIDSIWDTRETGAAMLWGLLGVWDLASGVYPTTIRLQMHTTYVVYRPKYIFCGHMQPAGRSRFRV